MTLPLVWSGNKLEFFGDSEVEGFAGDVQIATAPSPRSQKIHGNILKGMKSYSTFLSKTNHHGGEGN